MPGLGPGMFMHIIICCVVCMVLRTPAARDGQRLANYRSRATVFKASLVFFTAASTIEPLGLSKELVGSGPNSI